MIRQTKKIHILEKHLLLKKKFSHKKALQIFGALYKEAKHLKVFSSRGSRLKDDSLLRLAKFLNAKDYFSKHKTIHA